MALKLTNRNGVWYIQGADPAGRFIRKSCKTRDREKAEQLRAQLEAKLWKGHIYGEEAVKTFEDAALSYVKDYGEERFIVPVAEFFRGQTLKSITPALIREGAVIT